METVVFYRQSDGVVIGSHTSPGQINVEKELSGFGPGVSALKADYSYTPDMIATVSNGVLTQAPDPVAIANKQKKLQDRADGLDSIKKKVGLTDDQLKALFGG